MYSLAYTQRRLYNHAHPIQTVRKNSSSEREMDQVPSVRGRGLGWMDTYCIYCTVVELIARPRARSQQNTRPDPDTSTLVYVFSIRRACSCSRLDRVIAAQELPAAAAGPLYVCVAQSETDTWPCESVYCCSMHERLKISTSLSLSLSAQNFLES